MWRAFSTHYHYLTLSIFYLSKIYTSLSVFRWKFPSPLPHIQFFLASSLMELLLIQKSSQQSIVKQNYFVSISIICLTNREIRFLKEIETYSILRFTSKIMGLFYRIYNLTNKKYSRMILLELALLFSFTFTFVCWFSCSL